MVTEKVNKGVDRDTAKVHTRLFHTMHYTEIAVYTYINQRFPVSEMKYFALALLI